MLLNSFFVYADIVETKYFEIHHGFNENDLRRFHNEIMPKLDPFVDAWVAAGMSTPTMKTRILIEPDPSLSGEMALLKLYGAQFFNDLDQLISTTIPADFVTLAKSFALQYPPIFHRLLDREIDFKMTKSALLRLRERIIIERRSIVGDNKAGHMSLNYYEKSVTNAIMLGQSTDADIEHHYFRLDAYYHEIGHEFFSHMFAKGHDRPFLAQAQIPGALNEMIADVVAATYLNDPCRIKGRSGSCKRNLSQHEQPLNEHLWYRSDSHQRNQPIAHLMWEVYAVLGFEPFASKFVEAITLAIAKYPAQHPQISRKQIDRDIFLKEGLLYINDFTVLASAAKQICKDIENIAPICKENDSKFLGDASADFIVATNYLKYSPTLIGSKEQSVNFGGKTATIWFANTSGEDTRIETHFTFENASAVFFQSGCSRAPFENWTMSFDSEDGKNRLIWSIPGTVEMERLDAL